VRQAVIHFAQGLQQHGGFILAFELIVVASPSIGTVMER
jgi:hypothetical protein